MVGGLHSNRETHDPNERDVSLTSQRPFIYTGRQFSWTPVGPRKGSGNGYSNSNGSVWMESTNLLVVCEFREHSGVPIQSSVKVLSRRCSFHPLGQSPVGFLMWREANPARASLSSSSRITLLLPPEAASSRPSHPPVLEPSPLPTTSSVPSH